MFKAASLISVADFTEHYLSGQFMFYTFMNNVPLAKKMI